MRTFAMSTPSNMRRILNGSAGMPAWHAWQTGSLSRSKRSTGSRLRVGMSTVHASAVQPASSARLSMRCVRRPVRRRVELEPTRPAARRGDVLDGEVRDGREDLQRVLALGGARDGDFAFGVEHELRADGAEEDRRAQALAEHLDGHVDGADVDEAPRPQADLREPGAVRGDRAEVVGALRDVRVVAGVELVRAARSRSPRRSRLASGLVMTPSKSSAPESTASSWARAAVAASVPPRP